MIRMVGFILRKIVLAGAVVGGMLITTSAKSQGLLDNFPIFGPPIAASIRDTRDRSSDASVINHVFSGTGRFNNPYRPAVPSAGASVRTEPDEPLPPPQVFCAAGTRRIPLISYSPTGS